MSAGPEYTTGMLEGIKPRAYHDDLICDQPSLSSGLAWTLVSKSELHLQHEHPRFGRHRRKPTDEMADGTLLHACILKSEGAFDSIAVVNVTKKDGTTATDWRTDAAKEAKAAALADGKTPVLQKDVDRVSEAALVIESRMEQRGIVLGALREVVLLWVERASDGTPVQCRAMADALCLTRGLVQDLKTSESANPKKFARKILNMGHHVQAAAYSSAVEHIWPELAGRGEYEWVLAEQTAPHDVVSLPLTGAMRQCGAALWEQAIERYARALRTGKWPGYRSERIDPPAFVLEEAMAGLHDDEDEEEEQAA